MDTLNHATQGFISHYLLGSPVSPEFALIFGIVGGVIASCPDLIGEIKARDIHFNKWGIKWNQDGDNYVWYNRAHNGDINKYMKWIPAWGLHTWPDSKCHGENKRWYSGKWYEYFYKWKEMMWLEVVTWIINIIFLILIFK